MRGWARFNQAFTKANHYGALDLFEKALTLDPTNADALAGAAFIDAGDYANGWYDRSPDLYARAVQRANQAILLDPDQSRAHHAKALLVMFKAKRNDAASANEIISEAEASLRADPSFAGAYLPMAVAEGLLGDHERAISDLKQAMRISPRDSSIGVWYMQLGLEFLALGRYEEAIEEGLKAIELRVSHGSLLHGACGVLRSCEQGAGGDGRAGRGDEIESQTLLGVVSRAQLFVGRHGTELP